MPLDTERQWQAAEGEPCPECGKPALRFSHGVCPDCWERLLAEEELRAREADRLLRQGTIKLSRKARALLKRMAGGDHGM